MRQKMSAESIPFLIPVLLSEDDTNLCQTECKPGEPHSRKCYFIFLQNYDQNPSVFQTFVYLILRNLRRTT